jgi:predicted nuclease of predicted toxin-antitoxin system
MLFVFDENLPALLSQGLNKPEEGNTNSPYKVEVKHAIEVMGYAGAPDEDLIAKIGELNGILITQDRDFKNKKHYFSLYRQHNVGILLYTIQNKDIYWDKVKSFIRNWEDMKKEIKNKQKPFAFSIGKNGGVSPLNF